MPAPSAPGLSVCAPPGEPTLLMASTRPTNAIIEITEITIFPGGSLYIESTTIWIHFFGVVGEKSNFNNFRNSIFLLTAILQAYPVIMNCAD